MDSTSDSNSSTSGPEVVCVPAEELDAFKKWKAEQEKQQQAQTQAQDEGDASKPPPAPKSWTLFSSAPKTPQHSDDKVVDGASTPAASVMSATKMASGLFSAVSTIPTTIFSTPSAPVTEKCAEEENPSLQPQTDTKSSHSKASPRQPPTVTSRGASLLDVPSALFAGGSAYFASSSPSQTITSPASKKTSTSPQGADAIVDAIGSVVSTRYGAGIIRAMQVNGDADLFEVELDWTLHGVAEVMAVAHRDHDGIEAGRGGGAWNVSPTSALGNRLALAGSLASGGIGAVSTSVGAAADTIGAAAGYAGLAFSMGYETVRDTADQIQKERAERAQQQKDRREDKARRKKAAQEAHSKKKAGSQSAIDREKEERQRERDEEDRMRKDPPYLKQPQRPLGEIVAAMKTLTEGGLMSDIWATQTDDLEVLAVVMQFVHQMCEKEAVLGQVQEIPLKAWHVRSWSDVLHISKQAPYVLVLTSTSFFRVTFSKPPNVSVKTYIRIRFQDVIAVYMTTKKNQKAMTLLMIKDDAKTKVGQLANLATSAVTTVASTAARVVLRGKGEEGVESGAQEEDYFVHTPFYLTPQVLEQRAYTQEMLWAFQQVHRRFATAMDAVDAISPELVQQFRQERADSPEKKSSASGSPEGSSAHGDCSTGTDGGAGCSCSGASAAEQEVEQNEETEEQRQQRVAEKQSVAAEAAAVERKWREEQERIAEEARRWELEKKTQEIKASFGLMASTDGDEGGGIGSASGLFAEVDAREKKQLVGGGDGLGLFGDDSDSPRKLFEKPIFSQKDATAEDADKEAEAKRTRKLFLAHAAQTAELIASDQPPTEAHESGQPEPSLPSAHKSAVEPATGDSA